MLITELHKTSLLSDNKLEESSKWPPMELQKKKPLTQPNLMKCQLRLLKDSWMEPVLVNSTFKHFLNASMLLMEPPKNSKEVFYKLRQHTKTKAFQKPLKVRSKLLLSSSDFNRIVEVIETPNATKVVAKNIIMNGIQITNDMQTAFEALRSGEYRDYGMALGDTFRRATARNADLFLY